MTYEEAFKSFTTEMIDMGYNYHEGLYRGIIEYLGPSIYLKDAWLVSCSSDHELHYIREHFLIGKLGLENGKELDEVIHDVCRAMGVSNNHKHRATFYYLLTVRFDKAHLFQKG